MKTHLDYVRETWGEVKTYVREVWGADALHDMSHDGRSILIHLDRATPDVRLRRVDDYHDLAQTLAHADCPLCQHMAEFGGDKIYDTRPGPADPMPEAPSARACGRYRMD